MNPDTSATSAAAADAILPAVPAWGKRKGWNDRLARQVAHDPLSGHAARELSRCADRLGVRLHYDTGGQLVQKVQSSHFCHQRLCPVCSWRKATAWRRRLIPGLEAFHLEHPKHRPLFLTLTVRNCPVDELRQTIREMHRAWNRLVQRSEFPTPFWLRRTEVTLKHAISTSQKCDAVGAAVGAGRRPLTEEGADPALLHLQGAEQGWGPAMAHPHIHALLLVPARYFGPDYIRQSRWRELWMDTARLDYPPVVDVRRGRAKDQALGDHRASVAAAIEAAKYISKATDLMNSPELFREVSAQLRDVRMISVSGKLAPFVRPDRIDGGEMVDELTETEEGIFTSHFFAQWDESSSRYFFDT
jgi:plasmid rolling circle replication initiator protein Rep